MTAAPFLFVAWWPILDPTLTIQKMIREAYDDLPQLQVQARAELTGRGRFSMRPSTAVPGSGRITETVLVFEAPAVRGPARIYREPNR